MICSQFRTCSSNKFNKIHGFSMGFLHIFLNNFCLLLYTIRIRYTAFFRAKIYQCKLGQLHNRIT